MEWEASANAATCRGAGAPEPPEAVPLRGPLDPPGRGVPFPVDPFPEPSGRPGVGVVDGVTDDGLALGTGDPGPADERSAAATFAVPPVFL